MRASLLTLSMLGAALLAGCFPTFPNENAIINLRTIAIQQEPAVLVLDGQSLPSVTLTALNVDPLDEDQSGVTHTWTLDLGEDFEGAELLEELVPEGPYTNQLQLDFGALLGGGGARDSVEPPEFLPTEHNAGLLPLTYFAENDDKKREALKFVNFLVPDFEALPTFPTGPGTRPYDDYFAQLEAFAEVTPEGWNANPEFTKITVNDGVQIFEDDGITGIDGFIDLGVIEAGGGVRFDVELTDDKEPDETDVDFYWTHGEPGLPVVADDDDDGFGGGFGGGGLQDDGPTCYEPTDGEPEAQQGEGFGGGGAGLSEQFEPDRAFGWTAPCSVLTGPVRLFLIARDGDGGVAWQEVRLTVE